MKKHIDFEDKNSSNEQSKNLQIHLITAIYQLHTPFSVAVGVSNSNLCIHNRLNDNDISFVDNAVRTHTHKRSTIFVYVCVRHLEMSRISNRHNNTDWQCSCMVSLHFSLCLYLSLLYISSQTVFYCDHFVGFFLSSFKNTPSNCS